MALAQKPVSKPRPAPQSTQMRALDAGLAESAASMEAEVSVLGSMILNNDAIDVVVPMLGRDAFSSEAHRRIFDAVVSVHGDQRAVDPVTLCEELERRDDLEFVGGAQAVSALHDAVPAAANVEHYAEIVRDRAVKRDLLGATMEIREAVVRGELRSRELLDEAEAKIFKIAEQGARTGVSAMKDVLKAVFERIDGSRGREGMLTGLATGFVDLDELTSGLQNSELIIVAGRPSMGKTSFALNVIEHVGVQLKLPAVIFSLEMSREQLARNMLCSHARLDSHRLRRGILPPKEMQQLSMAAGALSEAPIYIDDTPTLNCFEIRAKVRRLKAQAGLRLAVIDYLQLVEGVPSESRAQQISAISRSLKGLAREMNIPVLAVAQLNRQVESREGHRPRMADLRESGSLEQDADVVVLMHRPSYYVDKESEDRRAELIIAKQRNGPTGSVHLSFLQEFTRFESSTEGMREY